MTESGIITQVIEVTVCGFIGGILGSLCIAIILSLISVAVDGVSALRPKQCSESRSHCLETAPDFSSESCGDLPNSEKV